MLKLIIEQKGHLIDFEGITPTRTPAEIDISRCNINVILSYLQSSGIKCFKLVSEEELPKKENIHNKKEQIKNETVESRRIERETHTGVSEERLTNIENLLKELLNKEPNTVIKNISNIETFNKPKIKKKDIKIDNDFIPTFQSGSLKLKGVTKTTQESSSNNMDNVEKLRRLKGDKNE